MYQSPFCPLLPIKWMLCKRALFFSTTCVCILCVCVFYFFHTHQRPKPKTYHFSKLFPKFSMCPPKMFPIAPDFKPICFAQNPPLLTYILGVFVAMGISLGEKLWWTFLRREIHPANVKCNHVFRVPWFFSF
jgi:hypothetical protein